MHRRDVLRSFIFGPLAGKTLLSLKGCAPLQEAKYAFESQWHTLPDMVWTGEDMWAQRLQDWQIRDGELQCIANGPDRTVHVLTHQLAGNGKDFEAEVKFRFTGPIPETPGKQFAGLRIAIQGRFDDYRSAIMSGVGVDVGVRRDGVLFVGEEQGSGRIEVSDFTRGVTLVLRTKCKSEGRCELLATVADGDDVELSQCTAEFDASQLKGNVAIVHSSPLTENGSESVAAFSKLRLGGMNIVEDHSHVYGPICFAQYTVHERILRLTAQISPVNVTDAVVRLEFNENGEHKQVASSAIHPLARIATFRINDWNADKAVDYRLIYQMTLRDGEQREFSYEGTIAREPKDKQVVRALAFSCNWDYGFPDSEVVQNAMMHKADLALFLGDQFYESNGRFGVQTAPLERAALDYLRKWYQFGWSYRDLFRRIPMIALLDDHDVYHGNIWGSGGRATILKGTDAERQDTGGYKMPPDWVNMAQMTQTSHMPDPPDPAPVLQGIGVYYTQWLYAGVNFGIIEDRKFKSAPRDILPPEANVWEGYAQNTEYPIDKVRLDQAELLGDRQIRFLKDWLDEKAEDSGVRILLSATPFTCLQTLPKGTKNDEATPDLRMPDAGEYVEGDEPTRDMDTNGWPQNRRDEVLRILKEKIALHLCGDQHLASVTRYGIDTYDDGPYCFCVPALCNIWPRRWWPPVTNDHEPVPGQPMYTGNFVDGFGNKLRVLAVANPSKSGRQPELLYDRATGYGVVEVDKQRQSITLHCFPRYDARNQYRGWPITFTS